MTKIHCLELSENELRTILRPIAHTNNEPPLKKDGEKIYIYIYQKDYTKRAILDYK